MPTIKNTPEWKEFLKALDTVGYKDGNNPFSVQSYDPNLDRRFEWVKKSYKGWACLCGLEHFEIRSHQKPNESFQVMCHVKIPKGFKNLEEVFGDDIHKSSMTITEDSQHHGVSDDSILEKVKWVTEQLGFTIEDKKPEYTKEDIGSSPEDDKSKSGFPTINVAQPKKVSHPILITYPRQVEWLKEKLGPFFDKVTWFKGHSLTNLIEFSGSDEEKNKLKAIADKNNMKSEKSNGKLVIEFTSWGGMSSKDKKEWDKEKEDLKSKLASITTELDAIASEFEHIDPRISLALDQISDKLEGFEQFNIML